MKWLIVLMVIGGVSFVTATSIMSHIEMAHR